MFSLILHLVPSEISTQILYLTYFFYSRFYHSLQIYIFLEKILFVFHKLYYIFLNIHRAKHLFSSNSFQILNFFNIFIPPLIKKALLFLFSKRHEELSSIINTLCVAVDFDNFFRSTFL